MMCFWFHMKFKKMNKQLNTGIVYLFLLIATSAFSQKKNEVAVSGTVYISSGVSNGAIDGKPTSEGPNPFKWQTIYFKRDSTIIKAETNANGVFTVELKEGYYSVYQHQGLYGSNDKLTYFGSDVMEVIKGGGPYIINFKNSSNRRSTMNSGMSGKGLPGLKPTKSTQKVSEK